LKSPRWKWLAIAGIVLGIFLTFIKDRQDDKSQLTLMQSGVTEITTWDSMEASKTRDDIDLLRFEEQRGNGVLQATAQDASPDQVIEMAQAAKQSEQIIEAQSQQTRQAWTICYFDHLKTDVKFDIVQAHLLQLAAKVQECTARVDLPTNSVWYPPSNEENVEAANLAEAKAAALLVAGAGVQLQQICPASSVLTPNLIQIGTSAKAYNSRKPVLSVEDISKITVKNCD
jgi:hypothetical protein